MFKWLDIDLVLGIGAVILSILLSFGIVYYIAIGQFWVSVLLGIFLGCIVYALYKGIT